MANNKFVDKKGRYELPSLTLRTVDQAVFDYFNKKLNVEINAPDGRKKVKVILASGERWAMIRERKGIRDENGVLILPLLTIQRLDIEKTPGFGGLPLQTNNLIVSTQIHKKTGNFQNQLKERALINFVQPRKGKVVFETLTIPWPVFCIVFYQVIVWVQFQEHMNEALEQIFNKPEFHNLDSFVIPVEYENNNPKGNGFYFVGFREGNFSSQSNFEEFTDTERIVRYTYNFKVSAYLLPDSKNQPLSYGRNTSDGRHVIYKQQSVAEIKYQSDESSMIIDSAEFEKLFG